MWRFMWYWMLRRDGIQAAGPVAGKKQSVAADPIAAWPKIDIPGRFHSSAASDYSPSPVGNNTQPPLFATPEEALAVGGPLGRSVYSTFGRSPFILDEEALSSAHAPDVEQEAQGNNNNNGGRISSRELPAFTFVPTEAGQAAFFNNLAQMGAAIRATMPSRRIIGRAVADSHVDGTTAVEIGPRDYVGTEAGRAEFQDAIAHVGPPVSPPRDPQPRESAPDNSDRPPIRMRAVGHAGFRVAPDGARAARFGGGRDYHIHPAFAGDDPVAQMRVDEEERKKQRLLALARQMDNNAAETFFDETPASSGPPSPPPAVAPPLVQAVPMFRRGGRSVPITRAPGRTPEERELLARRAEIEAMGGVVDPDAIAELSASATRDYEQATRARNLDSRMFYIGVSPRPQLVEPEQFFDELPPLESSSNDGEDIVMEDVD